MSNYSKERIQIGNTYKELIESGIKIDESSFINWVMSLYNCDYSTAKNGYNDGLNLIALQQQTQLSQEVDEEKIVNNIVENLDNKLSEDEEKVKEMFTDVKEI